jgi:hypothetical protein
VDTILAGRVVHQAFDANFRAEAADPASPPGFVDFANWMIDTPESSRSGTCPPDRAPGRTSAGNHPRARLVIRQE